jgi:hypothetical protein
VAGLIGSDGYTAQMRMNKQPCGDDLEAEAQSVAQRLEEDWTDEVLRATIRAGGVRGGEPV